MKITLISPNIVSQVGDVAGTGIPYVPISLVYLASYLKKKKYDIQFIDSFSENPFIITEKKGFLYQGLTPKEILERVNNNTELIILYAAQVYAHQSLLDIAKELKKLKVPIVVVENTQAVTAYSLQHAYKDFIAKGIDYVLAGESEPRIEDFISMLKEEKKKEDVDGLIYKDDKGKIKLNPKIKIQDPDELPFPDWDLIKLDNYWKLGYSHAPLTTGKYLPMLTSRGCPLICEFCVVPATNDKKWRPRSAASVVAEMEKYSKKYGVHEIHIEDLNPTVNRYRIEDICKLIIKKKLKLMIKFAAGTKAETFDLKTIDWMAKAGFKYISISPESGSPRILKHMRKYFNHEEALKLTKQYVKRLARAGLDEIALFIMTPVPGSKAFDMVAPDYKDISQLTFTPKWRKEYKKLVKWRIKILIAYVSTKLIYHPFKLFMHLINFITGHFRTKLEMTLYRIFKTHFVIKKVKSNS